jgi:hypothetical protein
MIVLVLLALATALAPVSAAGQSAISGVVRGPTGEPLRAAVVEVLAGAAGARSSEVIADSAGRYRFAPTPSGPLTIRASHVGYRPFQVNILLPAGTHLEIDLFLELRPVALSPIVVEAAGGKPAWDTLSTGALNPQVPVTDAWALGSGPGFSELGFADAARTMYGDEPADPSDVLYVRGAAADLKLVLLDGAPVFAPFHLGGLVDPFEPTSLQGARLYLGGAPARYDGGLAYILDLQTRRAVAGETRFSGRADLLSAQARLESSLGSRVRYVVTGRNVHGAGTGPWLDGRFPYGYRDGLFLVDVGVSQRGTVAFTGFMNHESVQVDTLGGRARNTTWSNQAASLRYSDRLGENLDAEFTLAWGEFNARLPLGRVRPVAVEGLARHGRLAADFARRYGPVRLRYGLGADHQELRYAAHDVGEEPREILSRATSADAAGAYVDGSFQLHPRLGLRGGLRGDVFSVGLQSAFAPRAALSWLFAENASLTLASGRYNQYIRGGRLIVKTPDPETGDSVQVPATLAVASATHVTVTLDQSLGDGVRMGLEGFVKEYEGIPSEIEASTHASGVDLWLHRARGRMTGWAGYSVAWVWSVPEGSEDPDRFSGRHLLTSGVGALFGSGGRFEVRFAYGAGLPYTAIPSPTEIGITPSIGAQAFTASAGNGFGTAGSAGGLVDAALQDGEGVGSAPSRDPYLRLDFVLSHRWDPTWRGVAYSITPYLKVLNALDRRETLFYGHNPEHEGAPRAVATLPILPLVGVEWRF